ncbi:hypothetical protein EV182_006105, partial [Spiromyces aspiralis]
MESLLKNCDKLARCQKSVQAKACKDIDELVQLLMELKNKFSIGKYELLRRDIDDTIAKVRDIQARSSEAHKDFYVNIAKYNKLLEKTFKTDLAKISNSQAFAGKDEVLALAIAEHFIRASDFELAERFCKDAGIALPTESVSKFYEMHKLVEEIRNYQLSGAI